MIVNAIAIFVLVSSSAYAMPCTSFGGCLNPGYARVGPNWWSTISAMRPQIYGNSPVLSGIAPTCGIGNGFLGSGIVGSRYATSSFPSVCSSGIIPSSSFSNIGSPIVSRGVCNLFGTSAGIVPPCNTARFVQPVSSCPTFCSSIVPSCETTKIVCLPECSNVPSTDCSTDCGDSGSNSVASSASSAASSSTSSGASSSASSAASSSASSASSPSTSTKSNSDCSTDCGNAEIVPLCNTARILTPYVQPISSCPTFVSSIVPSCGTTKIVCLPECMSVSPVTCKIEPQTDSSSDCDDSDTNSSASSSAASSSTPSAASSSASSAASSSTSTDDNSDCSSDCDDSASDSAASSASSAAASSSSKAKSASATEVSVSVTSSESSAAGSSTSTDGNADSASDSAASSASSAAASSASTGGNAESAPNSGASSASSAAASSASTGGNAESAPNSAASSASSAAASSTSANGNADSVCNPKVSLTSFVEETEDFCPFSTSTNVYALPFPDRIPNVTEAQEVSPFPETLGISDPELFFSLLTEVTDPFETSTIVPLNENLQGTTSGFFYSPTTSKDVDTFNTPKITIFHNSLTDPAPAKIPEPTHSPVTTRTSDPPYITHAANLTTGKDQELVHLLVSPKNTVPIKYPILSKEDVDLFKLSTRTSPSPFPFPKNSKIISQTVTTEVDPTSEDNAPPVIKNVTTTISSTKTVVTPGEGVDPNSFLTTKIVATTTITPNRNIRIFGSCHGYRGRFSFLN